MTPDASNESSEDVAKPRTASYCTDGFEQSGLDGLAQEDALSPFQGSIDLEQGQHMPHLIC